MELWIRSQDRERLTKANDIRLGYFKEIGWFIEDCDELGRYATKERALEVLDEIQKILKPRLTIKDNGKIIGSFEGTVIREGTTYELKELSTYVYEMPED